MVAIRLCGLTISYTILYFKLKLIHASLLDSIEVIKIIKID